VIQETLCRLCSGKSSEKFHLHGLNGIDTIYFECGNCGSLQTQEPTWLCDAYAQSNLSDLDTGAAQRVLGNHAFVLVAAKIFRLQTILDFGGRTAASFAQRRYRGRGPLRNLNLR
jgi:hypothetical protein